MLRLWLRQEHCPLPRGTDADVAGGWVAAAVYAAAKVGLADHLADGARSAAELAAATGTHAPSLHRFMRTLRRIRHPRRRACAAIRTDAAG